MTKARNGIIEETGGDYAQRLAQFIHEEGDKIRKDAEQESAHIVNKARAEYKQRLSRFLEGEAVRVKRQAEQDAADIIAKALEDKERILREAKVEAQFQAEQVVLEVQRLAGQEVSKYTEQSKRDAERIAAEIKDEARRKAEQGAAMIIDNANKQAGQIIAGAREEAKKQAEEENRWQAERIIEDAKRESAEIIGGTKQVVEEEVNRILTDALKKAEEASSGIIASAKNEAQAISEALGARKEKEEEEFARLITEAKRKSEWAAELIAEAKQKAKQIISDARKAPATLEDDADKGGKVDSVDESVNQTPASAHFTSNKASSSAGQMEDPVAQKPAVGVGEEEDEVLAQARRKVEELRKEMAAAGSNQAGETVPTKEGPEKKSPSEFQVTGRTSEAAPAEKDKAKVEASEADGISLEAATGKGEVEIVLGLSVDPTILTKLYLYLRNTPEIKVVRTTGSGNKGATIIVALDKPIPLVEALSAKIPEAKITEDRQAANGRREIKRINIAARGG